jgi:hypothetical protein
MLPKIFLFSASNLASVRNPRITHLPVFQSDKPIATSENLDGIVLKNNSSLRRAKKLYPTGDRKGDSFGRSALSKGKRLNGCKAIAIVVIDL